MTQIAQMPRLVAEFGEIKLFMQPVSMKNGETARGNALMLLNLGTVPAVHLSTRLSFEFNARPVSGELRYFRTFLPGDLYQFLMPMEITQLREQTGYEALRSENGPRTVAITLLTAEGLKRHTFTYENWGDRPATPFGMAFLD